MIYDTGFSHIHPLKKGYVESLDADRRIIRIPRVEIITSASTFDHSSDQDGSFAVIPLDSRDLVSYIRLIKKREALLLSGVLLGARLKGLADEDHGCPQDKVLDRFGVISTPNEVLGRSFGIDLRLLPPYDNLGGSLDDALSIIESDFSTSPALSRVDNDTQEFFINAVTIGMHDD